MGRVWEQPLYARGTKRRIWLGKTVGEVTGRYEKRFQDMKVNVENWEMGPAFQDENIVPTITTG